MAIDDGYTKSLLHFNGADESTTFTDESGKTWYLTNTPTIDTAQYKFGGASGRFDAGDLIYTADHSDFDLSSYPWTVDMWVYFTAGWANTNYARMLYSNFTSTFYFCRMGIIYSASGNHQSLWYIKSNGYGYQVVGSGTTYPLSASAWHHVAFVCVSQTSQMIFHDGHKVADGNIGVVHENYSANPAIGAPNYDMGWAESFNGWIDEFRFSKGVARWTSDFTPPTSEYVPTGGEPVSVSPFFNFFKNFENPWIKKGGLWQPKNPGLATI